MNDGAPAPVNADPPGDPDELVIIGCWLSARSMGITNGESWQDGDDPLFGVDFNYRPGEWRFGKLSDFEDQEYKSKLVEYRKKKRDALPGIYINLPNRNLGSGPDRSELNNIVTQIGDELRLLIELYSKLGGIRFDMPPDKLEEDCDELAPRFLIVCKKSDATRLMSCQPAPGDSKNSSILNVEIQRGDISRTLKDFYISARSNITLAHLIFDQFTNFVPKQSNRCFGGQSTPDLLPSVGETMDEWGQRVALSTDDINKILGCWEMWDRDMNSFIHAYRGRKPTQQKFLVQGLIPLGMVTMLVGEGGVGKSTLATALAAAVGDTNPGKREFLGVPVCGGGKVLYFTAEEKDSVIHARLSKFEPAKVMIFDYLDTLEQCASEADKNDDISLIVVDSFIKFLGGNEDSSDKTAQALKLLARIAQTHNCAVVVLHHMRKSSNSSWNRFRSNIRGSSAIVDQVRLVIGMMRRPGKKTEIAIVKSNLEEDDLTWGEVNQPRFFYRNKDTGTLDTEPSSGSNKALAPSHDDPGDLEELVLAVISSMNVVRRTGNKSVYANRGSALQDVSRAKIEGIVESLVGRDRLVEADGIISLAG